VKIKINTLINLTDSEQLMLTNDFAAFESVEINSIEVGPINMLEILLPPVANVIISEITSGFYKQIGADLWVALKNGIFKLFEHGQNNEMTWASANSARKEPTFDNGISIDSLSDKSSPKKSPPLSVAVSIDDRWHPTFIFSSELDQSSFGKAFIQMKEKIYFLQEIAHDIRNQEQAKIENSERFFGSMPSDMVVTHMLHTEAAVSREFMGRYLYDKNHDVWVHII
jgi:hypothetical protein